MKTKRVRFLIILLFVLNIVTIPLKIVFAAEIKGDHAVLAGGDINANDIIIKHGLTEDEVGALFLEYQKNESLSIQMVADLSNKLGVTHSAINNFFRIIGEKQVPPEKLLETLAEIAERHL